MWIIHWQHQTHSSFGSCKLYMPMDTQKWILYPAPLHNKGRTRTQRYLQSLTYLESLSRATDKQDGVATLKNFLSLHVVFYDTKLSIHNSKMCFI